MKEDLEAQTKALSMPRRSKSMSVHTAASDRQSPPNGRPSTPQSARILEFQKERNSNESTGSQQAASVSPPRNSNEKSRLRMFATGRSGTPSSLHEKGSHPGHRRAGSASIDNGPADLPQDVDDDLASVRDPVFYSWRMISDVSTLVGARI